MTEAGPGARRGEAGFLGIWQGDPPWSVEDLDEVARETDVSAARPVVKVTLTWIKGME